MSSRRERRKEAKRIAKSLGGKMKIKGTLKRLEKLKHDIAYMSLEEQSKYVDGVSEVNYNNLPLLMEGLTYCESVSDLELYQTMNATAVGNISFFILNTNYKDLIPRFEKVLERYKGYVEFLKNN